MSVHVSSTNFFRYLSAQSTTRVAKVRAAKKMMEAPRGDYKRIDYWLPLRESSVRYLTGKMSVREYKSVIGNVIDEKKIENYESAAAGLQRWRGRKPIRATTASGIVWESSGLEVVVSPELLISWTKDSTYVMKLYFSADPLSKNMANPMLRLLERTHGHLGTAAILDTQRAKLHIGPTSRPQDLDLLLDTEAGSFVRIWNSL